MILVNLRLFKIVSNKNLVKMFSLNIVEVELSL